MFSGLCAFPLTPLHQQNFDEKTFIRILARLTDAGVDSLGILGSTGSYAYLSREQRRRVVQVAKAHAGSIPMMVGVGAIATNEVLRLVEDAQEAGADALLLPMMSYQPLSAEEIFAFYEEVCRHASVPVCLYDNPRTTHVMRHCCKNVEVIGVLRRNPRFFRPFKLSTVEQLDPVRPQLTNRGNMPVQSLPGYPKFLA
ncbi:dihydrodipicolinate synthase [Klebsiella pneumoniae]|nr:dihydrodipicolinate synthase [Klebsiella pneumoniae]